MRQDVRRRVSPWAELAVIPDETVAVSHRHGLLHTERQDWRSAPGPKGSRILRRLLYQAARLQYRPVRAPAWCHSARATR
ncbi:hypothetical protein G6F24_018805 [Rhizopus arrhizus]|nr:hypothetical protein G6F24_018805 [Rhizopus arrhizus]